MEDIDEISAREARRQDRSFKRLIEIGIALSSERNHDRLLEMILIESKRVARADGGTLYLVAKEENILDFVILRNDSLKIKMGGTTGVPISFAPLQMYQSDGTPNFSNVATAVALNRVTVNISDVYESKIFDFSGTRAFDKNTGYRSQSFLTVPLLDSHGAVLGILQLINARDRNGNVIPFAPELQPIIEALSSQAAVALDNEMLIQAQRDLLDSFIELMAGAIDAKSPYTGGHCQRVPELTKMLAKAACESDDPPFRDFDLDEEGWYELHLAGWLHDCGKVVTPEFIVDKASKLETIYNRIHEIRTRFEVLRRDAEIECLKAKLAGNGDPEALDAAFAERCQQLEEEFAFIAESNLGTEFFADESVERLRRIGEQTWLRNFDQTLGLSWEELARMGGASVQEGPVVQRLLDDRPDHIKAEYNLGEIYNLSISRGTLTAEERKTINNHIVVTIEMLEQLPFPRQLRRVPEYAGGHHEKMDGTGYPNGLTRDEMSLPARMMAIADIFEALTAGDRPYKKAKMLSECLRIMSFMRNDDHIDPDLFALFLRAGIWRDYADQFLDPAQVDDIDIADYLGNG
jgi:HD-GYP domain-containing protein (c-di-GMP phosphodiesterase class II)